MDTQLNTDNAAVVEFNMRDESAAPREPRRERRGGGSGVMKGRLDKTAQRQVFV